MKSNKGIRHGWYFRNLASYLLLAVLLIVIVGVPVYAKVCDIAEDEIKNSAEGGLTALIELIDEACSEMDMHAYESQQQGNMIPALLQADAYYAMHACQSLQQICTVSSLYDSVALVYPPTAFRGEPKIYSANSVMNARVFFGYLFRYDQWDLQDLYNDMPSITEPILRSREWVTVSRTTRMRYYTYISPLSRTGSNRRGVILFQITDDAMNKWISRANLPGEASVQVTDEKGNALISIGVFPDDAPLSAGEPAKDWIEARAAGENHIFLYAKSARNGWGYALSLSNTRISGEVFARAWVIILYLGLGLSCAVAFSVLLTTSVVKPIRRLSAIASKIDPQPGPLRSSNELDRIERTMSRLEEVKNDLTGQLHSQRSLVRMHMLERLFYGESKDTDALLRMLAEEGICLRGEKFRVLVLRIDEEQAYGERSEGAISELIRYALIRMLREVVAESTLEGVCCEMSGGAHLTLLLNAKEVRREDVDALETEFSARTLQHFGFSMTSGASEEYEDIRQSHRRYREAYRATESRYMLGGGHVLYAHEPARLSEAEIADYNGRVARVCGLLASGGIEECEARVREYVSAVCASGMDAYDARRMMTLLTVGMHQTLRATPGLEMDMGLIITSDYETIYALENDLTDLLRDVCAARAEGQREHSSRLSELALDYMTANLAMPSINMESVAEACGASVSYLSRTFKEKHGATPMQRLDTIRMERACALLKDTDLKIADILTACGYIDKANFMRKFKKLYAMTPMEFRRAARGVYAAETGDEKERE